MSKAPAMPMYWDAYLADTTHLTTEEHGAYLLLLAAMWRRNGWVPDDDRDNSRILGLTVSKWRKVKARLIDTVSGFVVEDGKITQEKLQKTWKNTQEKIEKNRANGAMGGRPVSSKNNNIGEANGSISLNPNKSIPEPEPEPDSISSPKQVKDCDLGFDEFWACVPRKVGKGAARRAWNAALRKAGASQIVDGMKRYYEEQKGKDPKFIAHPASWLNAERWADEPSREGSGARYETEAERVRRIQNAWMSI